MKPEQLERYRVQLQAIAERVGQTAAALEEDVRTPLGGSAGGGSSNAPMHLGDLGSEAYTQELDATLLANETYLRDEALNALARIDAGRYGQCEVCGGPIPVARLEALPYARHCVPCATEAGAGRAVNLNDGRPAGWLGAPGYEAPRGAPKRVAGRDLGADPTDTHAAGTPGGGSAVGGLAGSTRGDGSPDGAELERAAASGVAEADEGDEPLAEAGPSGGAVGGTPANKRAKGKAARSKPVKPPQNGPRRTKRSPE